MAGKRVIVTGGSGKAGRYIIEYLLAEGYAILNLDIVPLTRRHCGPCSYAQTRFDRQRAGLQCAHVAFPIDGTVP